MNIKKIIMSFVISIFLTNCFVTTTRAACEYEYEMNYASNCEFWGFMYFTSPLPESQKQHILLFSALMCYEAEQERNECKEYSNFLPFPHPM